MVDVSIIVPVYCKTEQDKEWLNECLDSVVCQADEVICWNDGSLVDVSSIRDRFPTVVWREDEHYGVSHARNEAVKASSCEVLIPVDCDDVLVPGAISKLVSQWNGVPLYPDVYKFGDENVSHYTLLNFTCDLVRTKVGIASIGVLHSKEQWEAIGGWNESLDFYEDGEYNARLMVTYCGRRVPEPLYGYRIHAGQRTKLNKRRSAQMARRVIAMVHDYERSLQMNGCPGCGGSRRTATTNPNVQAVSTRSNPARQPFPQRVAELPGAVAGTVHAHYVGGKGRGKHYYQGPVTKHLYKVKHDDIVVNVDPRDASDPNDPGHLQASLLVRITPTPPPTPPPPPPAPKAPPVARKPVKVREKKPVVEETVEISVEFSDDVPDISNISYRELVTLDLTPEVAQELLVAERQGRARKKHIAYLKRRVG